MSPASSARIFSSFLSSSSSTTGPPAMFYCQRASAVAGRDRGGGGFLANPSVRCLPPLNTEARAPPLQPDPGAGHRLAIVINGSLRHIHGCGLVDALVSRANRRPRRLPDAHSSAVAASARRGLTRDLLQAVAIVILSHVQAFAQP